MTFEKTKTIAIAIPKVEVKEPEKVRVAKLVDDLPKVELTVRYRIASD